MATRIVDTQPGVGSTSPNESPTPITGSVVLVTADNIPAQNHSVLYWGKPKSGKTHCMCTWPDPIIIAFDPNQATLDKFVRAGKVKKIVPRDWNQFKTEIIPAIQNRVLDCRTVGVDSWSFAFDWCVDHYKRMGVKGYDLWGNVYEDARSMLNICLNSTVSDPSDPSKRTYNFLGSVHERIDTDADGNVVSVEPAAPGQARTIIGRMFNTVLIPTITTTYDGTGQRVVEYKCWSVAPDAFRAAGDGVGGEGGYNTLPPKVDGTYSGLCAAWGVPE